MKQLNQNAVVEFVEANIGDFHKRRADSFQKLNRPLAKVILDRAECVNDLRHEN